MAGFTANCCSNLLPFIQSGYETGSQQDSSSENVKLLAERDALITLYMYLFDKAPWALIRFLDLESMCLLISPFLASSEFILQPNNK